MEAKKALHQISFEIKEGEIFGFLGPSGSGKTTMINVLTGQLTADQGNTILLGKNSQDLTSNDLEQIGIVSDGSGFMKR
ncbi:ABC transporter ATP-binding protein [Streptococcus infantis SK1302]|uniref:ABC transporter ATP-binding protein n=1 Tax=Streptococcus infantis SK1302 TaxID=871237 RepID=A0ABP2J4G1_9STRE|nr:ABC transporter ATP-binding protein [Streptococcus infantis SK1302]